MADKHLYVGGLLDGERRWAVGKRTVVALRSARGRDRVVYAPRLLRVGNEISIVHFADNLSDAQALDALIAGYKR